MCPDTIAQNVTEHAAGDREVVSTFFEQHTTRCVVTALVIMRAAVFNRHVGNEDVTRMRNKNGVVSDVRDSDMIDGDAASIFDQDAVIRVECGERFLARVERHRSFESGAIAVDGESVKLDVAAAAAGQDGAAAEVSRGAKSSVWAIDLEVVRTVGYSNLRRHFDGSSTEVERAAGRNRDRKKNACGDHTLF